MNIRVQQSTLVSTLSSFKKSLCVANKISSTKIAGSERDPIRITITLPVQKRACCSFVNKSNVRSKGSFLCNLANETLAADINRDEKGNSASAFRFLLYNLLCAHCCSAPQVIGT